MVQQPQTILTNNMKQAFPAYVDNEGKIYAQQGFQSNQHIGYTCEKYSELESMVNEAIDKANTYKQQLIDAGLIKPQLTTEEQIAELSTQVATLSNQVSVIASFISNMSKEEPDDNTQSNNEFCKNIPPQKLTVATKNRTGSKSS